VAVVVFLTSFVVAAVFLLQLWVAVFGVDGCRLRTGSLPWSVVAGAYLGSSLLLAYLPSRWVYSLMRWRRVQDNGERCAHCDYDLTGNVSGTCPECGRAVRDPEDRLT
jgi:uncharacterized paraquat-inducible protein A